MRRSDRKVSVRGVFADPALKHETAAFRHLWTELVQRCRRADKPLEISPAEYKALIAGNCAYCGALPTNWTKWEDGPAIQYNGVDRVDNERGYLFDNLVPCCKLCNQFKSKLTAQQFIAHARSIVDYQQVAALKRLFASML